MWRAQVHTADGAYLNTEHAVKPNTKVVPTIVASTTPDGITLRRITDDPEILARDILLTDDERMLFAALCSEGWLGVARLSVERLAK